MDKVNYHLKISDKHYSFGAEKILNYQSAEIIVYIGSVCIIIYISAHGGGDMKNRIERYLKILKIELEDLEQDILDAEIILRKRLDEHKITDYVFMENLSTFKAELAGIKKMEQEIDDLPGKYDTLDEIVAHISDFIKERVMEAGLPEVVYVLIKRKLDKIYKYLG